MLDRSPRRITDPSPVSRPPSLCSSPQKQRASKLVIARCAPVHAPTNPTFCSVKGSKPPFPAVGRPVRESSANRSHIPRRHPPPAHEPLRSLPPPVAVPTLESPNWDGGSRTPQRRFSPVTSSLLAPPLESHPCTDCRGVKSDARPGLTRIHTSVPRNTDCSSISITSKAG